MPHARVNEVDLLRFIAALAVVFFHYTFRGYAGDGLSAMPYPLLAPFAKYGYLGAPLFFIISGFVILMSAEGGSLRSFAVSRFVRLYPAFWACCTMTFAAIIAIGTPRFEATVGEYLVNMTMLSGFFGVPSIDGAYWSLFVEMKFYVLVGVVLLIGRIHQVQPLLIAWLALSVALEIHPSRILRYFLIVDYSAYFIAGATYFLMWSRGVSPTRICIVLVCWGLAMFQAVNFLPGFEKQYSTGMSAYVTCGIVTVFFLSMVLVSLRLTGVLGRQRWLLAGALTYPLYLLHENIGFMVFNLAYPAVNPHVLLWGTVAAVLAAAYAVHMLVEKRFSLPLKRAINHLLDAAHRLTLRAGLRWLK
jgi:peptidoglycan/LPS O-acetylase OafA/YrhL